MKKIPYLLLAFLLCSQASAAQTKAQVLQNNAVAEGEQEEQLKKAWDLFASALISDDLKSIKALSMACIHCTDCFTATEAGPEQQAITLTGKADQLQRFVSIDHFLETQKPVIFNSHTISRLKDTTKIHFQDNAVNADLYADPCILKATRLKNPGYKEVLLLLTDPSTEQEGVQLAFAFIETKEGYKFCGYSTIP